MKRNIGIDLLRMVSMFMIVVLHTLGHGGVLGATKQFSAQYYSAWFLEIVALCAVNTYALISGYVGAESKYKLSNILILWLRVLYYSLLISLVFYFVSEDKSILSIVKSFFPIMGIEYWYFTAYFGMFFFIPFLNFILNNLDRKTLRNTLIAGFVVLSILQTGFYRDVFSTAFGYSPWWLMYLYLIGGYIRKNNVLSNISTIKSILGYLIMVFTTFLSKIILEKGTDYFWGNAKYGDLLVKYTSPTMLFCSVFLLIGFSKIKFNEKFGKVICYCASLSFSVYLIHDSSLVREKIMKDRFIEVANNNSIILIFYVVAIASSIYVISSCIDVLRERLFKVLKIKDYIKKIDDKIV